MKFKLATAAAAVLMSATASQAADLAKKAPVAVDYVKVCDAYGAGFFYIPGTETCLKIGGYVRAEALAGSVDWGTQATGLTDFDSREDNDYISRARILLSADARTATDMGVLRAFGAIYGTMSTGSVNSFEVDKAFIQWGGLTVGYAAGTWDLFTGYTLQRYFSADEFDNSRNLIAYTFGFGNGLSATLALEDSTIKAGRVDGLGIYGGNKLPDVVGKLTLAQSWGSAQVMAAAHHNYGGSVTTAGTTTYVYDPIEDEYVPVTSASITVDYDVDKWGYAVGAGAIFNLPMFGAGDQVAIQANYTKGALAYASANLAATAYDFDGSGDQSEAWSVSGGFRHVFSPTLMANIDASYASVDLAGAGIDFDQTFVAASVTWAPYGGVTGSPSVAVSGFVEYRSVDRDGASDLDGVVGGVRVQRNF